MGCGCSSSSSSWCRLGKKRGSQNARIFPDKQNSKAGGVCISKLIMENDGKVADSYDVDKKTMGQGSFGTVSKCINKVTGAVRACKTMPKSAMKNVDRVRDEIAFMKLMDHPNIIKLYETFEDQRCIYLIMEICNGGELFDRIIDMGHFTEAQAAMCMQHILRGIYYMHENHVCHRDLKPENFLFTAKDAIELCGLKIIDFGLAHEFGPGITMTTKVGTPFYVAPQVLLGKYDHLVDLWSLGVISYVLICGYPPFHGQTDAATLAKVRAGVFSFRGQEWGDVSQDAKNLISMLLKMNPRERYTAEQALNHVWVAQKAPKSLNIPLGSSVMANMRNFKSQNKLKKAALHVIANQMNESQIKALKDTFVSLDDNGDGLLTSTELKEGLLKAGFKEIPADLMQIMEEVDSNGSGVIDYTEFLAATLDRRLYIQEDVCWAAFRIFDRDGNGRITKDEILEVLGDGDVKNMAMRDICELMQEVDANGDGEIDFQEFMQMMRGSDLSSVQVSEAPLELE